MNKTYEINEKTLLAMWEKHGVAFFSQNVDAVVADFHEDGFVILNGQIVKGKDNLKKAFAYVMDCFGKQGKQTLEHPVIKDEIIYLKWRFVPNGKTDSFVGSDTFVVLDGKIHCQTVICDYFDQVPFKL